MLAAAMLLMGTACFAQTRNLPKPNMKRQTLSVMGSFKQRKSVRAYSAKQLSEQDLSDLLWIFMTIMSLLVPEILTEYRRQ